MYNRSILVGRLTKDPELRYSTNGVAVASFTLAVDRAYKDASGNKQTDFIPIVVFRQLAELCANYLSKGKLALVEGSIQVRNYDDQSGSKRYVTEIVASNVRFLSPKGGSQTGQQTGEPAGEDFSSFAHEISLDDDIPF